MALANLYITRREYPEAGGYLDQSLYFTEYFVTWYEEALKTYIADRPMGLVERDTYLKEMANRGR